MTLRPRMFKTVISLCLMVAIPSISLRKTNCYLADSCTIITHFTVSPAPDHEVSSILAQNNDDPLSDIPAKDDLSGSEAPDSFNFTEEEESDSHLNP